MDKLKIKKTYYSVEKLSGLFALSVGIIGLFVAVINGFVIASLFSMIGIIAGAIVLIFSKQLFITEVCIDVPVTLNSKSSKAEV